jgi:hypothetical protein
MAHGATHPHRATPADWDVALTSPAGGRVDPREARDRGGIVTSLARLHPLASLATLPLQGRVKIKTES